MTAALLRAWHTSRYQVGTAEARIGHRSPAMDAVLARLAARRAGFVTAWNPHGRRFPPGWNQRMQARLTQATRRLPQAPGRGGLGPWWEAHLLLAADPRPLRVLARRFRQGAIVEFRHGAPARLHVLRYR